MAASRSFKHFATSAISQNLLVTPAAIAGVTAKRPLTHYPVPGMTGNGDSGDNRGSNLPRPSAPCYGRIRITPRTICWGRSIEEGPPNEKPSQNGPHFRRCKTPGISDDRTLGDEHLDRRSRHQGVRGTRLGKEPKRPRSMGTRTANRQGRSLSGIHARGKPGSDRRRDEFNRRFLSQL